MRKIWKIISVVIVVSAAVLLTVDKKTIIKTTPQQANQKDLQPAKLSPLAPQVQQYITQNTDPDKGKLIVKNGQTIVKGAMTPEMTALHKDIQEVSEQMSSTLQSIKQTSSQETFDINKYRARADIIIAKTNATLGIDTTALEADLKLPKPKTNPKILAIDKQIKALREKANQLY